MPFEDIMFDGKRISQYKTQCRRCGSIYQNNSHWGNLPKGKPIPEMSIKYELIADIDEKYPSEKQERLCCTCYNAVIFFIDIYHK